MCALMSWPTRLARAAGPAVVAARNVLTAAVLGGATVGVLEGTGLTLVASETGGGGGLAAWAVAASLAAVGGFAALLIGLVALEIAMRLPLVRGWLRALSDGGAARAVLLWRSLLVALTALALGALVWRIAASTYRSYPDREPALFGSFVAVATLLVTGALAFGAAALDRSVARRVAATGWAVRAVDGRRARFALAACALVGVAVLHRGLAIATPGQSLAISFGACVLPVLLVGLRAARVGMRRREHALALLLLAAAVLGLRQLPGSPAGRGQVVARGLLSRSSFVAVTRFLADRDGDGYASLIVGGSDCDDGDIRINPAQMDAVGNDIDENCTGADARPAWLAERMEPRPAPAAPPPPRHNILLVSIDALRADHVGAWGYERATTPALDGLAGRATRFAWAFTSQPSTGPAVASIMTGRYPAALQWNRYRTRIRWERSRAVSLSEVLRDAGYDSGLMACCDRFEKAENVFAGFSEIEASPVRSRKDTEGQANSDLVSAAAISWLRGRGNATKPFFLYMHFIDAHAPYSVPPGGKAFGDQRLDLYDAEVAFADRSLGAVLAEIDALGLASSTIIVVTADHGEEFSEHGFRYHSRSLFNQVTRVPLVVHYPGATPRQVDTSVSVVDVMPTLLELVGLAGPGGMNGRSLAAAVRDGAELPDRPILLEVVPQKNIPRDLIGVVAGGWKVIWDREAAAWSLFSLRDDPDDARDLSAERPDQLAAMQAILFETIDRQLSVAGPQGPRKAR